MKRQAFVLTAALTACAPSAYVEGPISDDPSAAATYDEAVEQVGVDLAALNALELFDVERMVVTSDMTPGTCYGPCPDDAQREQAFIEQAARLSQFVALAEDAAGADGSAEALDQVDDNLDALDDLEIIRVGEFIETAAEANPNCYNLPCPEDEQAAAEANEARAQAIAELAERSQGL